MNIKNEIVFMQTRLIRLASEKWNMPVDHIVDLFETYNVFEYIEKGYGIFHCEGDESVLEDITNVLCHKGVNIHV